jgi:menaquinol-cytochrome c reductase iron-sulfur subunit
MEPESVPRRGFLSLATGLCMGLVGAALALPAVAYLVYPLGRRIVETPDAFVPVGKLDAFPPDGVKRVEIVADRRDAWARSPKVSVGAAFVRRAGGAIQVFSSACPHLACDVDWRESRFECPCHESAYGADGARLAGPARRGLDRLEHRVRDGILEVRYQRFKPDIAEKIAV